MALPPTTANDVMEWNDTNISPLKHKVKTKNIRTKQNKKARTKHNKITIETLK